MIPISFINNWTNYKMWTLYTETLYNTIFKSMIFFLSVQFELLFEIVIKDNLFEILIRKNYSYKNNKRKL